MTRPGLPKLIATDLDGTLVRSDETVSDYTHEVLARVRAAGIRIVGATGRGPRLIALTRRDIPSAGYLVMGGGGQILDVTDPDTPQVMLDERIDGAILAEIFTIIEAEIGAVSIMVEAGDGHNAPLWGDADPSWRYPDLFTAMTRDQALGGPVIKGFARHSRYDADALLAVARQVVPPEIASITQAGLGYIEICPPSVDKATGLAIGATAIGVDPDDALVFGDMPNDISMLRWAGFGRVAVANAHPAVKTMADEVIGSNDEDGVARYLDRMLRG